MTEDGYLIIGGIIVVIAIVAFMLMRLRETERRMHENTYKMKVYTDLLNAVTDVNLAGGDPYKMEIAKKTMAQTVNRMNLVASSGVLKSTNDLLDFFNEHRDKEFDTLRLHNILNSIVIEARRDLNPSHARRVEEAQVRYRFFTQRR